ncbi:aspartyl protease family protein [Cohnella fermenti]|uniref:Peptidase A2 domain-containing protein n=1 Tax=Cohnella fermenti TaxID=2565925 RepID=A0A4S4C635_9BACL|nr:aspartyl protease family protein [Cohnella fermenti]THF83333.1 hypothetical protein E6C55_05645 [Cohnella fermenti]
MDLDYVGGLLFSSITIMHRGKTMIIPNVVIDTGAAESILSIDAVEELFNDYEPEDQLRFMTGIGGREASVRRKIDLVKFHSFQMQDRQARRRFYSCLPISFIPIVESLQ